MNPAFLTFFNTLMKYFKAVLYYTTEKLSTVLKLFTLKERLYTVKSNRVALLYTQPKPPDLLQQACQFHQVASSLLRSGLLQLVI